MTRDQIQGPAGPLHIDDGGRAGVPVVFVHSFAGSSGHWAAQLGHLRATRRAVALDLRAHGRSAAPADSDYAIESLAADIAAVVDSLGLTRFVLVGHSIGGAAAIAYAGAHPERVAGLVLVGTPGKTPAAQAQQIMASMEANYDTVTKGYWESLLKDAQPAVRARVEQEMHGVPRGASLRLIRATFDFDPLPPLARYPGPKLAIVTSHNSSPNELHVVVPELPHRLMAGTSHWPHMDKPEEFNRLLDEFLATVT